MKIPTNLVAGAAGALLLNVLHELARKTVPNAPHVNEIGEEGLVKITESLGGKPPKGKALYASTLVSDFIGNAFYYSAVGKGKPQHIWLRAVGLGLTAGIGALKLPKKLGLSDKPVKRSATTKVLTVAWYTIAALAAAGVADLLQRRASAHDAEETVEDAIKDK